jgi:hypothetical protein
MVLNNNICSIIVEVDYIVLLLSIFHCSSTTEDNDWRYLYETIVMVLRRRPSVQPEAENVVRRM